MENTFDILKKVTRVNPPSHLLSRIKQRIEYPLQVNVNNKWLISSAIAAILLLALNFIAIKENQNNSSVKNEELRDHTNITNVLYYE
jgi:hypothetical protein